ncbi:MAG: metabolite traffic protein EboE [Akkermansiaceae bacterium]
MKITEHQHLAYCTNIHPAESWEETWAVLKTDVLTVRDRISPHESFAIGLRLSARAAEELIGDNGTNLRLFKAWLIEENCYVFTINGFPYGAFHDTRVKEKVYQPDWTTEDRLTYTNNLFVIIAELCPEDSGGSVSTLPGSFKEFGADENLIFSKLYACARLIETLALESGKDLHLGLEPEPLGHFENTEETLAFFGRFFDWCTDQSLDVELLKRRVGINYDTCHFALEFDDCASSLQALQGAGLRISKIHLSNALSFDPRSLAALEAIEPFDEPTYLHQVILKHPNGSLTRHKDLPDFFSSEMPVSNAPTEGRIHFHIPLYSEPLEPLGSTLDHAEAALAFLKQAPQTCPHLEIETYTWGVLPDHLQKPLTDQIAAEFEWVLAQQ